MVAGFYSSGLSNSRSDLYCVADHSHTAMNVQLYDNWRDIVKRAWSVRFMALAFIFSVLEVMLPFFQHDFAEPKTFAVLSGLSVGAAFISRLVAQKGV